MSDAPPEGTPKELSAAVGRLEARLDALEGRLAALETRAAGNAANGPTAAPPAPVPPGPDALPDSGRLAGSFWTGLSLAGRSLLALGGAFLLRAGTDSGALPPLAGVAAGLVYALVWVGLADRDAGRDRRGSAAFHGLTAILVGYPLIWEATRRFGFLEPAQSVLALTALTGGALVVSWRRKSELFAVAFSVCAAACALGLSLATRSPTLFAAWLVALGVVSLWISGACGWLACPWLVGAAANLAVLRVVLAGAAPGGHGSDIVGVSPRDAETAAAWLLGGYLGSFVLRTLWKRRDVGGFEIAQSAAILLVGLGGGVRVMHATGDPTRTLGIGAMVAGLAAYLVAFLFVRKQLGRGRAFFFHGTLALVLALAGCTLAGGVVTRTVTWSALAIAAAVIGGRFDRVSLRAHAGLYSAAAAKSSGLVSVVSAALLGGKDSWSAHPWAPVAAAGAACAYGALIATRAYRKAPRLARLPRLVLATVAVAGAIAAAAVLVTQSIPDGAASSAATPARTLVLAGSAVALAWAARRTRLPELGWVTWLVLAAGGAKLLLQDLAGGGESGALFLAFAFYGAALLIAPRLLRPRPPAGSDD